MQVNHPKGGSVEATTTTLAVDGSGHALCERRRVDNSSNCAARNAP